MTAASGLGAWAGIAVALTAFALLMTGLWLLGPTTKPEGRRKLFHVGSGLLALALPWLMEARWCAVVLMSLAISALLAVRALPLLRATLGAALHRVGRRTHGEFYFAFAVLALFLVAPHGGPDYQIPIMILTLADPMAALIGTSYGRHHLTRWAGAKTVEGSLACCLTAGVATAAILIFTGHQASAALLIALVVAVAVTAAEATGPAGSDNILVPTAAYLVLGPLLNGAVIPTVLTVAAVAAAVLVTIGLAASGPASTRPAPGTTANSGRSQSRVPEDQRFSALVSIWTDRDVSRLSDITIRLLGWRDKEARPPSAPDGYSPTQPTDRPPAVTERGP